jgi:hypothetical protein
MLNTTRRAFRMLAFAELRKRASEADAKLKRLYDAIENGVIDLSDLMLKVRIAELKAIRDQMRIESGGYRRDYLRALAQRVEVDARTSHHGLEKRAAAHPSSPLQAQKPRGLACPVLYRSGAPDTIRTCDLCLRRATLYPAELRVLGGSFSRLAGRRQRPSRACLGEQQGPKGNGHTFEPCRARKKNTIRGCKSQSAGVLCGGTR